MCNCLLVCSDKGPLSYLPNQCWTRYINSKALVQLWNNNEKNSSDHSEAPCVAQKVCLLTVEMKPATNAQFQQWTAGGGNSPTFFQMGVTLILFLSHRGNCHGTLTKLSTFRPYLSRLKQQQQYLDSDYNSLLLNFDCFLDCW